ncbi:MAG TPA: hypothetical protein VMZ71_08660 [Gemmataceae bacterium]|nr:hypothetical protein [Gemmataceae bacterium]
MARGRKTGPTRLDKRRESEAAEAREKDDDKEVEEEEEEEASDGDDGDDEDGGKKKKAKAKPKKVAAVKKPAVKRTRAPKEVRQKAIWVVFDNASKRVGTFAYNQKEDAEALLASKIEEKKGTFYLNLVKEPLE